MQKRTLEVVSQTAINHECVNDIAASGGLAYLLILCETLPVCVPLIVSTLFTLVSNTKMVKDLLECGKIFKFLIRDMSRMRNAKCDMFFFRWWRVYLGFIVQRR